MHHFSEVIVAHAFEGPAKKGVVYQLVISDSQITDGEIVGLMGDLRVLSINVATFQSFHFVPKKGSPPPRLSELSSLGILPIGNSFPGAGIALQLQAWDGDESPEVRVAIRSCAARPEPPVDHSLKTLDLMARIVESHRK
jgi:hypothetical protein